MEINDLGSPQLDQDFLLRHIMLYVKKRKFPKSIVLHKLKDKLNKIDKNISELEEKNKSLDYKNNTMVTEIAKLKEKISYKLNEYSELNKTGI